MRWQRSVSISSLIFASIWFVFQIHFNLKEEANNTSSNTICSSKHGHLKNIYQLRQAQVHKICLQLSEKYQISYNNYVNKRHLRKNYIHRIIF